MSSKDAIRPSDDSGNAVTLQALNLPKQPSKQLRRLSEGISLANSQNMHWSVFFAFVLITLGPLLILVSIQAISSQSTSPNWLWYACIVGIGLVVLLSFRFVPAVANSRDRETSRRAIKGQSGDWCREWMGSQQARQADASS